MGDGGCAVLSSRHPLAEFRNSEPRHREQLKSKRSTWGVELGSARGKEHTENALSHDHRSSSWPPVPVNDMEPGSAFQVGDTATEGNDKQSRRQHSRWDVRAEGIVESGAACELRTRSNEVACHIGSSEEEQVKAETDGLVNECCKESHLNNTKVVNDNGYVNFESQSFEYNIQHHKMHAKDQQYRNEQFSVISTVTCIDSSMDGNTESSSQLINQETIAASGIDGSCGLSASRDDSNYRIETSSQVEKGERALETEAGSSDHLHESRVLSCWDYFIEYGLDESIQGSRSARNLHTGVLHYNRRSKRESKEKRNRHSNNELLHSVTSSGCSVMDSGDASRHDVAIPDSLVSRDGTVDRRVERETHDSGDKRNESPGESKRSSSQEEFGGDLRRKESPDESKPSSRQDESGGDLRRKESPGEREPSSRQEEFGGDLRRKESLGESKPDSRQEEFGGDLRRKESPGGRKASSRQEEFGGDLRTNDSDGCAGRSFLCEKTGPCSHRKDICSGIGDSVVGNGSDDSERSHLVTVDVKHQNDQTSSDDKDRKIDSEDCSGHYQDQSATSRDYDSWPAEMDVPMDLSPAPAEDIPSSPQVMCMETVDLGLNEHIVPASDDYVEEPNCGDWIYLDSEGITQGPINLSVLKRLMREGRLQPDHMVQLDGSNAWITLEHAGSTLAGLGEAFVLQSSTSSKAEVTTQQGLPPMAFKSTFDQKPVLISSHCELSENFEIDNRVDQLMQGFPLVSGKEKEIIVEALDNASRHKHSEIDLEFKDEDSLPSQGNLAAHWSDNLLSCDEYFVQGQTLNETVTSVLVDGSLDIIGSQSGFQSSRMWTSRGGDWRLMYQTENAPHAKGFTSSGRPEKLVLNQGKPLCERTHHRLPDPRRGSALYEGSISRTLELPPWAHRYWEAMGEYCTKTFENLNAISASLLCTARPQVSTPKDVSSLEGLKKLKVSKQSIVSEQKLEENLTVNPNEVGLTFTHLPFVSVGLCDKDEGPSSSSVGQDLEVLNFQPERQEVELSMVDKTTEACTKSVQHVLRKDELLLETGEWFYQDGNGQEIGPYTFSQLQSKVRNGFLYEGSSVYRKSDETWVPLFTNRSPKRPSTDSTVSCSSRDSAGDTNQALLNQKQEALLDFHQLYPQFIGFMCGRLHEHVMKSYKSRDFAAMVDEGSRSCFGDKRSKKTDGLEMKFEQDRPELKHRESNFLDHVLPSVNSNSGLAPSSNAMDQKDSRVGRMKSLLEIDDGRSHSTAMGADVRSWSMINSRLLTRVFKFLETDIRSLVLASITCKSWRAAFTQFKRETTQLDFSTLGSLCSDDIFCSFTEHSQNISRLNLRGCTALSPSVVKAFLQGHHAIEFVDAKGCDQLKELMHSFPQISFSRSHPGGFDSSHKSKGVKSLVDRKGTSVGKHSLFLDDWKGKKLNFTGAHIDGVAEPMDCDTPHLFPQNLEASHGVISNDFKRLKLQSTGKLMKVGADSYYSKVSSRECSVVGLYTRDKEQFDLKHKQNSLFSSTAVSEANVHTLLKGESSPAIVDRKLEKEMTHVLQCLRDLKIPYNKKMSSLRCQEVELSKIEDKLRRGSYTANMQGLRAFKSDLLDVARMLFRLKELPAGNAIFTNTFRLTNMLLHELKGKDMPHSKPFKRKYEELKSSSSLSSRKRGIGNAIRDQVIGKRRKGHDESSDEDECEYNFASKSETSGTDEEDDYLSQDDKDEDSAQSESEVETESEGEGKVDGEKEVLSEDETDSRIWGARMTKASMVPPATRKYELIEEYVIVADADEVKKRMGVNLPKDYDKMVQAQEDRGIEYSHLEMPELREFKPRKHVLEEVVEQEVYGIDPYTHNLLIDSMPTRSDFSDVKRHQLIEEDILKALNQEVRQFTGTGKAPTKYPLESVVNRAVEECRDPAKKNFISALAKNMRSRKDSHMKDTYVAYRKGLGVVCNHATGFDKDEFIVEFFGEVYPAWRWFEKQDAIRSFQRRDKDPAPEFYNIFLERPKGDASGYDLVVVDAMHKANYASRICHSCRPNCEARVTAVNGRYQIGVYTLRPVEYGEELTFDYNSITESKEEHEKSVCLCGSHVCRGSYLNFAGPDTFQEIMKEDHSLLHRHDLLLHACIADHATTEDWDVLKQAGLGSCLLDGLPGWTIKYAAGVVRFVNEERKFLPREILKSILSERRLERAGESEAFDAEIQADGVFNSRLQNLAITLDKVRYVFKKIFGDPGAAPPPLRMLKPAEVVALIWKHEDSVVADLFQGMSQHISKEDLSEFKRKVREHEPSQSGDIEKNLQQSLLWLRDELCKAPIACVSRHDGAADLIHMYAYTKLFFTCQNYPTFESPSLTISPLDLGPKHAHKLGGASSKEWTKTYSKDYVLGQLIFWYKPNVAEPGASLTKASKGCLSLPSPTSCYAKSSQQRLLYGSMDRLKMFRRMEHKPSRPWSWKGQLFWEFRNNGQLLGSPMMDSIHQGTGVNKEMLDWLKRRTRTIEGSWDRQ